MTKRQKQLLSILDKLRKRDLEINAIMNKDGCTNALEHPLWNEMETISMNMASICIENNIKTDFKNSWNPSYTTEQIFTFA